MADQKEMSAAERKELEALRAEKAVREREADGIVMGEIHCGTQGCDFERQPAELKKITQETINADLGIVENSFDVYLPAGETPEICPMCEYPLTLIEPNAQSAFPKNYRWIYPKPVE